MGLFSTTKIYRSDNSTHHHSPRVIHKHEHKATTDESVLLLNEFKEKAKADIVKTVFIDENELRAAVLFFREDHPLDQIKWTAKFTLNGIEKKIDGIINGCDLQKQLWDMRDFNNKNNVMNIIIKEFTEALRVQFLKSIIKNRA